MSLFSTTALATDADLTAWESKMPALATKMNCFTGKRQLAKNYIAKQLLRRGVDPATLTDPTQLKDAAVFKELEFIFMDMAEKEDGIASNKAKFFARLFEDELELVLLTITAGAGTETVQASMTSIPLLRA